MGCPTACVKPDLVQKIFEFFACPGFLKFFNIKPEAADKILQSDFNCGFLAALATVVVVLVLFLVIRILIFFIFRKGRCSKVIVPSADGELIVTRKAIEAVVRKEVESYSQIQVRKLLLFKRGKKYSMTLYCQFGRDGSGMPEIAQDLKGRLKEVMNKLFGIDTMHDITICIERLKDDGDTEDFADEQDTAHADTGL